MEHDVYFWAALIGCTLLVIQIVLQVIGLGGEHDLDASSTDVAAGDLGDHDPAHGTQGNIFFGILSFKTLVAFAGIFGLTGLSLLKSDISQVHRVGIAILAGLVAMVVVAYMMRALYNLGASGSVVIENAVGHQAEVYLRIPSKGEGRGKVTVEIQGRTLELPAVTDGAAIATGDIVKVIDVVSGEIVKVIPA
jgi:hypothetical protein